MSVRTRCGVLFAVACAACASPEATGLRETPAGSGAAVVFDVDAKPLPNIPLPNDFATRFDATTLTQRRINASLVASTQWERGTREDFDRHDGWGTSQAVTVSFDGPLDLHNLVRRHQGDDYDARDDVAYLIDITEGSPTYCQRVPLDFGEGNFPLTLEEPAFFDNDRHGDQLLFEDREEDLNGNGRLDLGEDLDMDGVLDHPNTLNETDAPWQTMPFYERETNTLIMKPVVPLRERGTYAVVLTNRLLDAQGRPVRSPFSFINHAAQTRQLRPLESCLPNYGLSLEDVAFTWAYTTQSVTAEYVAVRDGLYGLGPLSRLASEFPGDISKLLVLRDAGRDSKVNVRIANGEQFRQGMERLLKQQFNRGQELTPSMKEVVNLNKFIDFHVVFQFVSPQFFPRVDSEGNALPLYRQVGVIDPLTGAAQTRPEIVTAWVTVPKARHGAAPVVILGHGYGGSKLDSLVYAGLYARQGLGTVVIDAVSHGTSFDSIERQLGKALLAGHGLGNMFDAVVGNDRAFDQNGDGVKDPAADFLTAYVGHTRDVVKQSTIDFMQLIRVMRGFDGVKRWAYDANADGTDDLAGDFDGDGVVDVGGNAPITMTGSSLGGILSSMLAGLEPQLEAVVPISAGAGLFDVGTRSMHPGVREAVTLRVLGPLLVTQVNDQGQVELWEELPDGSSLGKVRVGIIDASLKAGDTAVLFNLTSHEYRCARVGTGGLLRVAVGSDQDDLWRFALYSGALPPQTPQGCQLDDGLAPYWSTDAFGFDVSFQGKKHQAGEPLLALGDGFGLRRQSPELRRYLSLAQVAMERGDPINFVPFARRSRVLRYGTGEEVATRMVVVNTVGDTSVPVAAGASLARAAGLIELFNHDERYGKTPNRVLIDTGLLQGVERVEPYTNSRGAHVLMDVEHLSLLTGSGQQDRLDVPRLSPPLRLIDLDEQLGGMKGVLFPMPSATGQHGLYPSDPTEPFDLSAVMFNGIGRYLATNGDYFPLEGCAEAGTCTWLPAFPAE